MQNNSELQARATRRVYHDLFACGFSLIIPELNNILQVRFHRQNINKRKRESKEYDIVIGLVQHLLAMSELAIPSTATHS
jgi:hypothetical protein